MEFIDDYADYEGDYSQEAESEDEEVPPSWICEESLDRYDPILHRVLQTPSVEDENGASSEEPLGQIPIENQVRQEPQMLVPPARPFRLNATKVLLTYPRADFDVTAWYEWLQPKFGSDLDSTLICEEDHAPIPGDEYIGVHRHAILVFTRKQNIRDARFFDFREFHPNIQGVRNFKRSIDYVKKGGNYRIFGNPVTFETNDSDRLKIAKELLRGNTVTTLIKDFPSMIYNIKTLEYAEMLIKKQLERDKLSEYVPIKITSTFPGHAVIQAWLEANIKKKRRFKQKQLYIWSRAPNMHKTSIFRTKENQLRIYWMPEDETFYDLWDDEYDLIIFDEFKGQKQVTWLDLFLQGSTMTMRKKGSQAVKRSNPPTIIIANCPLHECYRALLEKCPTAIDTLQARLIEVHIEKPLEFAHWEAEMETEEEEILNALLPTLQ